MWIVTLNLKSYNSLTILSNVRQHNHFITQGNYKVTCFDYRLVILRSILSCPHGILLSRHVVLIAGLKELTAHKKVIQIIKVFPLCM